MVQGIEDGLNILLAEDDPLNLLALEQRLTSMGHRVIARATTGKDAVYEASRHQPDLVLMDVKMPRMDGIEAARVILSQRFVPIILITAYNDPETLHRALEAGVTAYLVKPMGDYELKQALQAAGRYFQTGGPLVRFD